MECAAIMCTAPPWKPPAWRALLVRLKEDGVIRDLEVPSGEIWRLTIPPGVVHAFRNTGEAVMVLVSFSTNLHDPTGGDTQKKGTDSLERIKDA